VNQNFVHQAQYKSGYKNITLKNKEKTPLYSIFIVNVNS
jgi:hypothetical protein